MITGKLESRINNLWEIFWMGGIINPLDVVEQMTYLMFIHDLSPGKISEKRYQTMAPSYEWEQAVLKAQREDLAAEIAQGEEIYDYIEPFLPIIWKYTNITELNAHIIITLRTVSGRVFESHYPLQKSSVQIF